jgi:hypothetical protein
VRCLRSKCENRKRSHLVSPGKKEGNDEGEERKKEGKEMKETKEEDGRKEDETVTQSQNERKRKGGRKESHAGNGSAEMKEGSFKPLEPTTPSLSFNMAPIAHLRKKNEVTRTTCGERIRPGVKDPVSCYLWLGRRRGCGRRLGSFVDRFVRAKRGTLDL